MATLTKQEHMARIGRIGGIRSSRGRVGDSAWGRSMMGKWAVKPRWKPWMKAKYDMTQFPFRLKPEYRD